MMFYYIDTIEQVKAAETSEWNVNEYGARSQYKEPLDQVRSRYFTKLAAVSNDLISIDESKNHYFMDIKIVNSEGGIEEKKQVGTRVELQRKQQPQPEPVEEV